MSAYYNEIDPYAAQWLRNLIAAGEIAPGDVDERSIVDVKPDDLNGYTQCHFFAGIGGWSIALRLAGWPDTRPVWTGSCPCQPFSGAGKLRRQSDERHLWPYWARLIAECRPPELFGEQVERAIAAGWLDDAFHDMEVEEYACAAAVLPACSVGAPHQRDRVWFVAHVGEKRYAKQEVGESPSDQKLNVAPQERGGVSVTSPPITSLESSFPLGPSQVNCIPLEVDGVPYSLGAFDAFGNAIVPQVAAEFITAYMEAAA